MIKILRSIAKISIFLCLIFAIWVGFYAYNEGFTKKWRKLIMEEFDRRGIEAEIGKLTIDPLDGLVARNIRIYSDETRSSLVASINNITLDIDLVKLLRKKQFLNSVEFRDTDIFLPIDPNLKDGEKIKITDLKARVRVPGKSIDIENAQCFLNGIKINLSGSLIQKSKIDSSFLKNSFENQNAHKINKQRSLISSIIKELKKINYDYKKPPNVTVRVVANLNEPEKTLANISIQGENLSRLGSNYQINYLNIETEYENGDFIFKNISLQDRLGELKGNAQWISNNSSLPFSFNSSIDLAEFTKSFIDNKYLEDLFFIDTPQITATGSLNLSNNSKDEKTSIKLFGSIECDRIIFKDTLFEKGKTNFSYNNSKFYFRNLSLEHESGTISGNYLQDRKNEFRFDTVLKMDPEVLTSLAGKSPEFLKKLDLPNNPTVDVQLEGSGNINDTKSINTRGTFTIGSCEYNDIPLTAATGKISLKKENITISNFRLDRKEGYLSGNKAEINLTNGLVSLTKLDGNIFPHITAGYFSNSVSETLGKYQFNDPPYITLNGIIDTKDNQETSIVFTFNSSSTAKTKLFNKVVTINNPKGSVSVNGNKLDIRIDGEFVDGKFRHIGSASLNEDDGYYSGRIQAENLQFGKLVNTFDLKSKTNGIVGGDVGFKIPTKKPENWNGEGTLSLTQGNVFSIPILGPISPIISSVLREPKAGYSVAKSAKASFRTRNGLMNLIDFQALTPGFILRSNGFINLTDNTVNLEAEMNARGHLNLVGWPLSRLLRYKGSGELSAPKWEPVNFSIPRNIIADGEKVLKNTNPAEIIPEAIGIIPNTIQNSLKVIEDLTSPNQPKQDLKQKENP